MLAIEWVHPVYKAAERVAKAGETTIASEVERPLSLEEAYALIASGDRRPLLVLRECERCKGTDHALLSRTLDNEQTVLLTHWFRCVKLPTNVVGDKHPLHALFARQKEGERIPHLFFADPDGQNRRVLPGDQAQSDLWDVMFDYLHRCYAEDAKDALKELRQVLSQYDKLDVQEQNTKNRIDREIEENGPKSPKIAKLEDDLVAVAKKRQKLAAQERELRDLALKAMQKTEANDASKERVGAPAAGAGSGR